MTLAELIEEVTENVALHPQGHRIVPGEILRLLNLAQREISVRIGIPQLYLDVPTSGFITGAFALPTRIHPEGIKYAEVVEVSDGMFGTEEWRNHKIDILSVAEANRFHPRWEEDDDATYCGPAFLVWSPASPDAGIRPVGITTAKYRFLVYAVPLPMEADTDEPFAVLECDADGNESRRPGAGPAYHRLLAHHVTYELLQRLGDERWQAFYARYRDLEAELFSQVMPVPTFLPSDARTWRRPRA